MVKYYTLKTGEEEYIISEIPAECREISLSSRPCGNVLLFTNWPEKIEELKLPP